MKKEVCHFILSAILYGLVTAFTCSFFYFPSNIITLSVFLPPLLGIMWGPSAAIGIVVGGIISIPAFLNPENFMNPNFLFGIAIGLFLTTCLPYLLWHKWLPKYRSFDLETATLWKFVVVFFITFVIVSVIRALTAPESEVEAVVGLFGYGKKYSEIVFMAVCFLNDFFVAIFIDVACFFILLGKNYPFYNSENKSLSEQENFITKEENKALTVGAVCYLVFPVTVIYLNLFQIYGMNQLETWITFVLECLAPIDGYVILVTFLLLRYRRSIMMEIVFLVAMTVFLSASVLGLVTSITMGKMVNSYVEDSLHAMSVICRERLDRTFFCVRQAVNGMERQATKNIESYDRFKEDSTYRKRYLDDMEQIFESIAMDTDGCLAYYLRLAPEIEGNTKSGFSFSREEKRWEGSLSPFIKRDPQDLALYSPDDTNNVGWFYTPLKSKTSTWIEPYVDPTVKNYVISYVAPLFVEDKFIGVIGIDIDFNFIIQELRRMSIYDYGYVYLMNRNNTVLYHKDQIQGSQFQPSPDFQEMEIYLTNGMWLGIATPLTEVHNERNHLLMHLVASILIIAMLVSIGSIAVVSRAIRPLEGMTEAAKRIASGDLNVQISYESGNELGILVRSIREMASKLEIYVYRDKLTGLRNVAAYTAKRNELDAQGKLMSNLNYAVVLFDVNFLKKVNDNYGHQAGDQLIRHAARVICRVFEHSPVYRIGGDEFVAVLEKEDYENREKLLRRFDEKIAEESFEISGETINISVARGIGIYKKEMDFAAVSKIADSEMYNHKAAIKAKYGEEVR